MPRLSFVRDPAEVPASSNPRWAFERAIRTTAIPAPAKLILLTLASSLGAGSLDLGLWTPGTRLLAEQTSLHRNTLIRHLALLETHGWLTKRVRKGKRSEYVLSAGRPFTDETAARVSNLPGGTKASTTPASLPTGAGGTKASTGSGTKASTGSGTKASTTVRPSEQSEQSREIKQDSEELNRLPSTGRSPASMKEKDQGVVLRRVPPRERRVDAGVLLAGMDV
jgi:hypothetical protein